MTRALLHDRSKQDGIKGQKRRQDDDDDDDDDSEKKTPIFLAFSEGRTTGGENVKAPAV